MVALSRNSGRKEFQFITEYLHIYYEEHVTSGYVGKTLWVDLSEGMIHEEALDDPLTSVYHDNSVHSRSADDDTAMNGNGTAV
jgi:hypothetical protein